LTDKEKTILIRGALRVVTMNDTGESLENGDVLVASNHIEKVGQGLSKRADEVIDATGMVVLPGLVNTHHHLYQTLTRNLPQVRDKELFEWLLFLYEVWRGIDPESIYYASLVGMGELLLTGCTTTLDQHYIFPETHRQGLIERQIEAAREIGIRFHPTRGSMSRGRSEGGLPPDDLVQPPEEILRDSERLLDTFHDPSRFSMVRVGLAPCSPFSIEERLLHETRNLARDRGVLCHTHVAETEDETEFCRRTYELSPVRFMERVGWLGEDVSFAHCIHLSTDEIGLMAETGTAACHCPTSNMRLSSGIAPVREFLDAGATCSLAVDGSASNDSSNALAEVRNAFLLSRLRGSDKSLTAHELLWAATRGGAKTLMRDDIGSIEPGKAADLSLFDLRGLGFAGALTDPEAALVYAGNSQLAHTVLVNGEIVVRNGRLTRIDEERVASRANELSRRLLKGH
jgi:cytosine/adenosine deaminase-related metal-dependent hydrolase